MKLRIKIAMFILALGMTLVYSLLCPGCAGYHMEKTPCVYIITAATDSSVFAKRFEIVNLHLVYTGREELHQYKGDTSWRQTMKVGDTVAIFDKEWVIGFHK